jgi:hypothetical protein
MREQGTEDHEGGYLALGAVDCLVTDDGRLSSEYFIGHGVRGMGLKRNRILAVDEQSSKCDQAYKRKDRRGREVVATHL